MTLATVRRLAADILSVGENKIRINPEGLKDAEGALTRSDVKGLIEKGIVIKLKNAGRTSTKKKTRRGHGHRKGSSTQDSKKVWMVKIRAQRRFLSMLLANNAVDKKEKRILYKKLKSGIFRNKRAFLLYLKDNKFVAKDYEPPKAEYVSKPRKVPKQKQKTTTKKPAATDVIKAEPKVESEPKKTESKGEKQ
ncbi:MAG: 50S ribosomal protein L19e [Candidatus Micrarchaeota archaeon]